MSLEASDSGGFEAFWPGTEPATKRIKTIKIPERKRTVIFINAPPKFEIQPDRGHPVRPRAARNLSETIPLEDERAAPAGRQDVRDPLRQLLSNRKVISTLPHEPGLY